MLLLLPKRYIYGFILLPFGQDGLCRNFFLAFYINVCSLFFNDKKREKMLVELDFIQRCCYTDRSFFLFVISNSLKFAPLPRPLSFLRDSLPSLPSEGLSCCENGTFQLPFHVVPLPRPLSFLRDSLPSPPSEGLFCCGNGTFQLPSD